MSEEQLWSIPDDVESIYIHYTTEDLLKGFREEALRHREEISQLKSQLQQKENIIKEAIKYIESYMPNYDFDKTNLIKLLEILQGSDKE